MTDDVVACLASEELLRGRFWHGPDVDCCVRLLRQFSDRLRAALLFLRPARGR